jgi:hypothetical protein
MIFRTYEHYYENENEDKFENIDCFVCLENILSYDNTNLNFNNNYNKICNCNGYIHIKCLEKWYLITKSCPICRNPIIKNNNSLINNFLKNKQLIINNLTNNMFFFIVINTIIKIIYFIQIFMLFLFIYNIIIFSLISL